MKRIIKSSLTAMAALAVAVGAMATSSTTAVRALSSCPTDLLSSFTPHDTNYNDAAAVNVGAKFKVHGAPFVHGVKFYKGTNNTGTHVAHLRDVTTSTDLALATYSSETSSGWQTVDFSSNIAVSDSDTYMVWVSMPNGHYAVDGGYAGGPNSFGLRGFGTSEDVAYMESGSNGVYEYTSTHSTVPTNAVTSNYWVSPVVGDSTAPGSNSGFSASDATAGPNLTWSGIGRDTNSVTSSANPVNTLITRTSTEEGTVTIGKQAGGASTWQDGSNDPTAIPGRSYTYGVKNQDACGNLSTGTTSSVTPASAPTFSHLIAVDPPSTLDTAQTTAVTVGVRWNTNTAGNLWGVRFYRAADTAPTSGNFRVGLWDNDGTLLASRTVPTGNDQSGWIDVRFNSPVSVDANHDYIVGYYSPNGQEVYTNDQWANTFHPIGSYLTAPGDTEGTPNGVYSTDSSFHYPDSRSTHQAWYGVDVDFYVP